jgi:hypothetical protein
MNQRWLLVGYSKIDVIKISNENKRKIYDGSVISFSFDPIGNLFDDTIVLKMISYEV